MWIFQHKELTGLFALSIALFIPFYFIFKASWLNISSTRAVFVFFLVWVGLHTAEYFLFGANSFIATDTDSRNISFLYFLAKIHHGGQFAHEIAGGQDLSLVLPGMQYFVPEKLLLRFLDPWIVVWFHKLAIGTLGFFGSYLLARGMDDNVERFPALAAATVFPVSHIYLNNYSIEFGTGFAAVPMAVYAAVICVNHKNFIARVIGAGVVLALAEPMKVFPAALLATVCALILYDKRNIYKTAGAFAFYILLSIANWHEVLYGILVFVDQTTRGFGAAADVSELSETLGRFFYRVTQNWFVAGLFALSISMLVFRRDRLGRAAVGSIVMFSACFLFADLFPWQAIGLSFINRIEHSYLFLALPVLVVPVAAKAFSASHEKQRARGIGRAKPGRMAVALLAAAFCLLSWNKFLNFAWLVALGGQSSSFGFAELKNPDWKTGSEGRAVTLFDVPPPNVTAAFYGIDSFDGTALLNPKPWNDYWASIKNLPLPTKRIATRPSVDWRYWNGGSYAVGENFRLDLLRIANVKYLISALPLTGKGLTLIRSVDRAAWTKTQPGFFPDYASYLKSRVRRIFDPGGQYIYGLSDPLPRVFAATGVVAVSPELDTATLHEKVAAEAPVRRVVVADDDAKILSSLGALDVVSFEIVADGYNVRVRAPEGGILVVNNLYSRFWQVKAGAENLRAFPANGIHMAVAVPAGSEKIEIRYRRPTLYDQLVGHL